MLFHLVEEFFQLLHACSRLSVQHFRPFLWQYVHNCLHHDGGQQVQQGQVRKKNEANNADCNKHPRHAAPHEVTNRCSVVFQCRKRKQCKHGLPHTAGQVRCQHIISEHFAHIVNREDGKEIDDESEKHHCPKDGTHGFHNAQDDQAKLRHYSPKSEDLKSRCQKQDHVVYCLNLRHGYEIEHTSIHKAQCNEERIVAIPASLHECINALISRLEPLPQLVREES
mmetsp:Transcript_68163/g.149767  ORF Transcript_68163/g.149767 Transcript_68163/m.149767 type:complete len:225 (+) Transcript_68163:1332-2006(+)